MIETFIGWGEGRYFRGRREGGYILVVLNIKVIGTFIGWGGGRYCRGRLEGDTFWLYSISR